MHHNKRAQETRHDETSAKLVREERSHARTGTSWDDQREHREGVNVPFSRSKLSDSVRDLLWCPPRAEDSDLEKFHRNPLDPDEGWSFDPENGILDLHAPPPANRDCDDRSAARVLRGLGRASLARIRAGSMKVRDDGAAHAALLRSLSEEMRAGDDGEHRWTSSYYTLALSLSVLERRCVDLYISQSGMERGTSPMLSEVLRSTEFSRILSSSVADNDADGDAEDDKDANKGRGRAGALLWALRRALHPRCLNLRNVVWHGFIAPPDVQPELAALALALAASIPTPIGEVEGKDAGRALARHDAELTEHNPALIADGWWSRPQAADEAAEVITQSDFIPSGWRAATIRAVRSLLEQRDEARFVAVACPALEDALREMFADVNDAPEACIAQLGVYYTTLDGFSQAKIHDVLLHPLRASTDPENPDARRPNQLLSTIPGGVRNALEDLFMRGRGPALRAAYAHGSVELERGISGEVELGGEQGVVGACVRLLLLIIMDMCDASRVSLGDKVDSEIPNLSLDARPTLAGYDALFHPSVRFRTSLEAATRSIEPILGPSRRFTFTVKPKEESGDSRRNMLVLVLDAEAEGANGESTSRAGFTEKATRLGDDFESQEVALKAIVSAFLDIKDAPLTAVTVLSHIALGSEGVIKTSDDLPPSPGLFAGTEALRATADEVTAAATSYLSWIERLVGATERREARSNHRRQLISLLKGQTSVALGLCVSLLAAERLERIAGECASDEDEIGSMTTRLLSHASMIRAACEAGQGADAVKAAAGVWETKAGRALLRRCIV